ncbi:MAG: transmembrane 220 family protein [Sinomicrobium sp.]|nr:transmembrane 220 family protein [Sinomicrobium sp.]
MQKTIHIIVTILFLLFAAVQYNDPDGWKWILIYLFVAGIVGFGTVGRRDKTVILAAIGISGIWMLTLIPDFIHWIQMGMPTIVGHMKAEAPHIELTREFLGLVIILAALWWQFRLVKKSEA